VGDLDEVVAGRDEVSDLHSDPAELVTSGAAAVAATARLWLAEREARLAAEAAYEHVLPLWRRAIRGVRRKIRRQRRSRRLRAIGQ
jgi:hypothetical protein